MGWKVTEPDCREATRQGFQALILPRIYDAYKSLLWQGCTSATKPLLAGPERPETQRRVEGMRSIRSISRSTLDKSMTDLVGRSYREGPKAGRVARTRGGSLPMERAWRARTAPGTIRGVHAQTVP